MGDPVVIEVPGEPVAKGRPRFVSTGDRPRAFTPAKTRNYEMQVRYHATRAMDGRPLFTGPLNVSIVAYLPLLQSFSVAQRSAAIRGEMLPAKKPDLDNFEKAILDALEGVVFCNDSQVCFKTASKRYGERPRVRVEVAEIKREGVE